MSKITVPIEINPPLKGYLGYAHPLSILFGDGDDCMPWVLSNFIQMISLKDCSCYQFHTDSWFFSDEDVFLHYYIVLPKTLYEDNWIQIKEIMLHMLTQGYCAVGIMNEYYVPHRFSYQRLNFDHDYLIYGYDECKDSYNIIGYTDKRHYEPSEVTDAQFFESLKHTNYEMFHMHFFKKKPDKQYAFDVEKVKMLLKDYLESKMTSNLYNDDYLFGIEACKNLKNYLDLVKEKNSRMELRYFYALKEHKECMLMRIRYMMENHIIEFDDTLENACKDIISQAEFIVSLCIRWNLLHDPKLITTIKDKIDQLISHEIPFINTILCKLDESTSSY